MKEKLFHFSARVVARISAFVSMKDCDTVTEKVIEGPETYISVR